MESINICIKGRVQGVGFRMFVYNAAKKLNIKGSVENSISATNIVEILAQGESEDITKFINIIRNGPTLSRVDAITKTKTITNKYDKFIIK